MSGACDNTMFILYFKKKLFVCWSVGENNGAKIVQNVFGREREREK
jgi:hypothetical protein